MKTFDSKPNVNFFDIINIPIRKILNAFYFAVENSKARYAYTLVGEKYDETNSNTILLYRLVGKRHILEMTAIEICNSKELIQRFHPLDVRIISFIAGFEHQINYSTTDKLLLFKELKESIFSQSV